MTLIVRSSVLKIASILVLALSATAALAQAPKSKTPLLTRAQF
jgi:hypothetical protein